MRAEVSKPLNLYLPFVMIGATPLREILLARSPKVLELVASEELSAIPKVAFEPCEPVIVTALATVWTLQVVFLAFIWRYSDQITRGSQFVVSRSGVVAVFVPVRLR